MRERSRAKSSAANIRPDRRGVTSQIWGRFMIDCADSIKARILRGGEDEDVGRRCDIMSVTNWRSDGLFTFGMTRASRCLARRTVSRLWSY